MLKKLFFIVLALSTISFPQIGPRAAVQEVGHDFGTIQKGSSVSYTYIISNSGGEALKLSDIKTTCGCTVAKPDKDEIAPGDSAKITVTFNSAGRSGKQEKYIYIKTNDPVVPTIRLMLTADVVTGNPIERETTKVPKIYFSETTHNFGEVVEGSVVEYTFKFSNQGKKDLHISDIKTSCGCTAALVSSKELKPGEEGTLKVELDTTNRSGKISRNITVKSDDPSEPYKVLIVYADIKKKETK